MSKMLMMNFRSKNIGVNKDSNANSIQSIALRNMDGGGGSSMNLSQHGSSNGHSLSAFADDNDSGSKDGNSSWGAKPNLIIKESNNSQGDLPRIRSDDNNLCDQISNPLLERNRSGSNRQGGMSFFG